jgi:hypothetical protein
LTRFGENLIVPPHAERQRATLQRQTRFNLCFVSSSRLQVLVSGPLSVATDNEPRLWRNCERVCKDSLTKTLEWIAVRRTLWRAAGGNLGMAPLAWKPAGQLPPNRQNTTAARIFAPRPTEPIAPESSWYPSPPWDPLLSGLSFLAVGNQLSAFSEFQS